MQLSKGIINFLETLDDAGHQRLLDQPLFGAGNPCYVPGTKMAGCLVQVALDVNHVESRWAPAFQEFDAFGGPSVGPYGSPWGDALESPGAAPIREYVRGLRMLRDYEADLAQLAERQAWVERQLARVGEGDSRVGGAIGKPSEVPADHALLVGV